MRQMIMAVIALAIINVTVVGQESVNTAGRMMQQEDRLTIGGYGQIDYNQPLDAGSFQNGALDVHRLVLLFGYKFNEKTQFITEVEFEHVKEVYVEQAFLQHEITPWMKFRGGLILVPMGIINEYHEPSTFNGVERPNLDKYIVPTTWREVGAGFTGVLSSASLSYQLYVMNGFNGYDGDPHLSGADGFRKGRQKGAESFMSSPNISFRVNYFGVGGLQLGISGYGGKSQSSLFHGLERSDSQALATADSSVVGLAMLGADARYTLGGLNVRAQGNVGMISNADQYNAFTGSDLGSSISGWYGELSYNVLHSQERIKSELIPFFRFEQYNTHVEVDSGTTLDPSFDRSDLTFGLGWKMARGAMIKADFQLFKHGGSAASKKQFNAGVAVWF